MTTLIQELDDNFGSHMGARLYFDFNVLEAVTLYLKDHQRTYRKTQIKKIFNQFINKYVVNQLDLHENPLGPAIDDCFEAWWKGQPEPRTLEQQEKVYADKLYTEEYYQNPLARVLAYQDEQEMYRQMHANDDELGPSSFKTENTPLIEKLLSTPKEMRTIFLGMFKGITRGQLPDKLEESGILDSTMRNRVMKNVLSLCDDPKSVMELTDNELPLSSRDVAHWVNDQVHGETVYMQDSNTQYYLRDNKYVKTPDYQKGDPINNALEDYYDLCADWEDEYPLFSRTINKITDRLQEHTKNLYYLIGKVETHTEEEFNSTVATEGRFCTRQGLYNYTHKISDSNGLTKVCTKANILDQLTDQEINSSEGVQLFAQFITQIMPKQENRDYLIGVIANAITGHRENEYTYIFHGATGANGKSVLMALLQDMLGDYYEDYSTDSLVRHSQSESPEQAAKVLEGRRLVGGREIGDGSTIDGGAFKRYFSNDSYTINEKFKPTYTVKPTHTMFLPVNQMPNFGSDPAVRRRLIVIPFTEHFVNNPDPRNPHEHKLDPTIQKKLIEHEDEIFTYLVRYAEQLRKGNITLTVPEDIRHYGDAMVDEGNVLVDVIGREGSMLTEEQMNDPTIPKPLTTGTELFERYMESLPQGTYSPYKTQRSLMHAFLLKYPQLSLKAARTTDGKVVKAICGIWLDPTTTAAIKLAKSRTDDNGMPVSYPTFKANSEYQDWLNTHTEK